MERDLNVYILISFYSYQKWILCNKDFSLIWREVYSTKVLDYCFISSSLIFFTTTTKTAHVKENIVLSKSLPEWMSLNCPGSVYYLAIHVHVLSEMKVNLSNLYQSHWQRFIWFHHNHLTSLWIVTVTNAGPAVEEAFLIWSMFYGRWSLVHRIMEVKNKLRDHLIHFLLIMNEKTEAREIKWDSVG